MTKLEQKLKKLEKKLTNLGYKRVLFSYCFSYIKQVKQHIIHLEFYTKSLELANAFIEVGETIKTKEVIDNLQHAFNEMQENLEILKEIEKNEKDN